MHLVTLTLAVERLNRFALASEFDRVIAIDLRTSLANVVSAGAVLATVGRTFR
jgi:hypothetical protein